MQLLLSCCDVVLCRRRGDAVIESIEQRVALWAHLPAIYGEQIQVRAECCLLWKANLYLLVSRRDVVTLAKQGQRLC